MSSVSKSPRLPVRLGTGAAQWCSKHWVDDKKSNSEQEAADRVCGRCGCCDTARYVVVAAARTSDYSGMLSSGQKTRASQMQIDGKDRAESRK